MNDQCEFCPQGDPKCPGVGLCHCGCAKPSGTYAISTGVYRSRSGQPRQYLQGHWTKAKSANTISVQMRGLRGKLARFEVDDECPWCEPPESCPVGAGMCHCGCGASAGLWERARLSDGILKGMPRKTLPQHPPRNPTRRPISDEIVRRIRYEYATDSTITQSDLARRYGISRTQVSRILNYKVYVDAGIATGP